MFNNPFLKKDLKKIKETFINKVKHFYYSLKNLFYLNPKLFIIFFILFVGGFIWLVFFIVSTTNFIQNKITKREILSDIEVIEKTEDEIIEKKDDSIFNINIATTIDNSYKEKMQPKETVKISVVDEKNEINKKILELNVQKENKANNLKYEYDTVSKNIYYKVPNKELYRETYNKIDIPNKKEKEDLVYYVISKAEQQFLKTKNKSIREVSDKEVTDMFNLIILEEKLNNIDYIQKKEVVENQEPYGSYSIDNLFVGKLENKKDDKWEWKEKQQDLQDFSVKKNKIKIEKSIMDNGKEISVGVLEAIVNKDIIPISWLPTNFSYTVKQEKEQWNNGILTGEKAADMIKQIENFQSYTQIQSDFDTANIKNEIEYSPERSLKYDDKVANEFNELFYKAQAEYEKNKNQNKQP